MSPFSRRKRYVILTHRAMAISLAVVVGFVLQIYARSARSLRVAESSAIVRSDSAPPSTLCPVAIDTEPLSEGLVCIDKCAPRPNNTIEGLGLDPNERIRIAFNKDLFDMPVTEFDRYRVHFPEEGVTVNLTAKLIGYLDRGVRDQNEGGALKENNYLHHRPITERLLRRVVAKLLRAGILDPSKDIVNTGSWIGDNALPWAMMMSKLRPQNPGSVIAVDPSETFVGDMVDLANVNGINNLCARIGILSSNNTKVGLLGDSLDHIKVRSAAQINSSARRQEIYKVKGKWMDAFTLDSLNLHNGVSLLHLDVEGHEGDLLLGAHMTIQSNRPIIITEGYDVWDPIPEDENDRLVAAVMNSLGYTHATEIPEHCGVKSNARNRIWWPDVETRDAAMAVVGKELNGPLVPWIAVDLPDETD